MMSKNLPWIGALCAAAGVAVGNLRAQEPVIAAAPVKAALAPPGYQGPVEYEGKVMVVNRSEGTVTVDIGGRLHLFKPGPKVRLLKKGKPATLNALQAGQRISVVARLQADGTLDLMALALDTELTEAQPAAPVKTSGVPIERKPGLGPKTVVPPPFQGGYLPGHVEKVVVSPNK